MENGQETSILKNLKREKNKLLAPHFRELKVTQLYETDCSTCPAGDNGAGELSGQKMA